jgi:hypothetical protein
MTRYNLTIARPEGFLHSSAFIEIRDSLGWALTELGHEANCAENYLSAQDTNIVFGAETLAPGQQFPRADRLRLIIYNLEQPTHPRMDEVRRLARDHQIWDFSQRNVEAWKAAGYDARWVPVAYTPHLSRIPQGRQDIDVFFAGWLTPRRLELKRRLEELDKDKNWKIVFSDSCYGGGRDNLIGRSKLCLNVHHDGRNMTEIVRLAYLLANHKAVISETSSDDADYKHLSLSLWSYDQLPHAVRLAVYDPNLRFRMEQQGFQKFSRDKLVDHLKRVLR